MDQVTCRDVSVFNKALTRGKIYNVLAYNEEKNQVKIEADNSRIRWFPFYCFNNSIESIAQVKRIQIDDQIESPYCDSIEVTIYLLVGEEETKRWCYFRTPAFLYRGFGFTPIKPQIFNKHGIILPVLTVDTITEAISYLENHNLLEECTLPFETDTG